MKTLDSIAFALTIVAFSIGIVGVLFLMVEYSHQENMAKIECVKAKGD